MPRLSLFVKPGCKTPGFERLDADGSYVLRVRERAVDGAANAACIRDLAERLKLRASQISLLHGERSRCKLFEIGGISDAEFVARLEHAACNESKGTPR